jgi:hypothetical protein
MARDSVREGRLWKRVPAKIEARIDPRNEFARRILGQVIRESLASGSLLQDQRAYGLRTRMLGACPNEEQKDEFAKKKN